MRRLSGFLEVHADCVDSPGWFDAEMVQILVGHGDEFALFLEVDGGVGGLHVAGGVRFDFDEAEDVSFPADEVRFLPGGGA